MNQIKSSPEPTLVTPSNLPQEISLEEIDRLLVEEDPDFSSQLSQIKSSDPESDVIIESELSEGELLSAEPEMEEPVSSSPWIKLFEIITFKKVILKMKVSLYSKWMRLRNGLLILIRQLGLYANTLPREFFNYLKAMIQATGAGLRSTLLKIHHLSWSQKILMGGFFILTGFFIFLMKANLSGAIWWPVFFHPSVVNLGQVADQTWDIQPQEPWQPLFQAFPQDEIEFLFPKIFVNLKATPQNSHAMGAFEFYAVFDSQDAALEAEARQKELHDLLQRALEEQTYAELNSPLGRRRVKDLLRRTLNEALSQGWARQVLIKTMVLKP